MKFIKALFLFMALLTGNAIFAQNTTTLTGTVTDSDTQAWNYAIWTAQLFVPGGSMASFKTGGAVPTSYTGTLTSTGVFSGVVANAAQTIPSNIQWVFTICSNTDAPCQTLPAISISGSTYNAGTYVSSQITAPRIQITNLTYAYNTSELTGPFYGAGYVNTSSGIQYWYANGGYQVVGIGASLPIPPSAGGTGDDTSTTTGVPILTAGNWSYPAQEPITQGGTGASTAGGALNNLGINSATTATFTGLATGVTSVVCAVSSSCNSGAGYVVVTVTTYTTGNAFTVSWPATTTAQLCFLGQQGGGSFYVWGTNPSSTTTGFIAQNQIALSAGAYTIWYICKSVSY